MYIMNLIHDICLTKIRINNIPRWKFISKNKEMKNLDRKMSEFLNLDIFNASDNIITFLISLNKKIYNDNIGNIWYTDTFIAFNIPDDIGRETNITYYPISNHFEIWNNDVAYNIYRNTKISNRINKMWEPLTNNIKERYLNIIIHIVEELV